MLFEPESLLFLARRSGLDIYRRGGRLVVVSETSIPKVWAEAIKRHKSELLPLVPNNPATPKKQRPPQAHIRHAGENYDLFGQIPKQDGNMRHPAQRRTKAFKEDPANV